MRRDIYPLYNLDLKPLSSVFDNFDSETHEHIMLNSRLWEKYYGNNLLYSNGSLVPHTSDLRLFKVQRYFGLDFYSRDKIYPVPDENNSFDSFIRVEFEGDSVKILPFLISQDGNPSPYLSFDGLLELFIENLFFQWRVQEKN